MSHIFLFGKGNTLPKQIYLVQKSVVFITRNACCDMGQNDTIGKIELNPSFVLSSDNTNYKNDIQ